MPGVKGRSGGARIPGPGKKLGPPYQNFTLKLDTEYGVSVTLPDKHFPMQVMRVVEINRKFIVFEKDGLRVVILR